ncbi:hypothetical protein PENTCL1PPCAC_932 [Pristionchus entomophagus]|uniref:Carboxylesterase type B domain-containing protein n=1 Tax=Pristionchus entomophagus TaxID=358040 RepID=A0AAV5S8L8_9BILA|nr:hypothetical protein PENTCL1PPCAC_932 [Pristionchus entomophagus]
MRSFFYLCIICLWESVNSVEYPVITTSYGSLRGVSYTAQDGTEALIFKKIPFVSPPIGDLRWKKPVPPQRWNVTLDSTFFGPACAQRTTYYEGPITGFSEDCLHLNVFTNRKCRESNSSCAVFFIIHGGAGIFESTMKFPDETLVRNFVSQNIVVVSTAYRLGMFGAIALGDENAVPANLALYDILAALRFTRSEIGNFGGDKERITLFGNSVGLKYSLMIAFSPGISKPGEKRLINGVIAMSGSAGLETQDNAVKRAHNVATELGCEGTAREIMDCLRRLDTNTILEAEFKVRGPRIDSDQTPNSVTITGELFPIINERETREGKDPIRLMTGTTMYEMSDKGSGKNVQTSKIPRIVGVRNEKECYEKYLNDTAAGVFVTNYDETSQQFILSSHLYAKYQAEIGGEAYLYEYDYPVHATHTDDVYFVLGFHEFEKDENEQWMARVYPRYFANFINGRRPAEDWYPVKPSLMNYYSINRSITDDVYPHMKFGYQDYIVKYYDDLVKYDNAVTLVNHMTLNAPVEYK